MKIFALSLIAAVSIGLPVMAQTKEETKETLASAAEVAQVNTTLAKIGCKADEVEKESAKLFEVDDAECAIGQYDIKLDADYKIVSMTIDE